jgi:hypothetical protein
MGSENDTQRTNVYHKLETLTIYLMLLFSAFFLLLFTTWINDKYFVCVQ